MSRQQPEALSPIEAHLETLRREEGKNHTFAFAARTAGAFLLGTTIFLGADAAKTTIDARYQQTQPDALAVEIIALGLSVIGGVASLSSAGHYSERSNIAYGKIQDVILSQLPPGPAEILPVAPERPPVV